MSDIRREVTTMTDLEKARQLLAYLTAPVEAEATEDLIRAVVAELRAAEVPEPQPVAKPVNRMMRARGYDGMSYATTINTLAHHYDTEHEESEWCRKLGCKPFVEAAALSFLELVAERRAYQRVKWGDQADDKKGPWDWAALLARYVGRVTESACGGFNREAFWQALVDVAAVAQAAYDAEERVHNHAASADSKPRRMMANVNQSGLYHGVRGHKRTEQCETLVPPCVESPAPPEPDAPAKKRTVSAEAREKIVYALWGALTSSAAEERADRIIAIIEADGAEASAG